MWIFLKPTRYKLQFFLVFGGYFVLAPFLLLLVLPMLDFLDHLGGLEVFLLIPVMLVMVFFMPAMLVAGGLVTTFLDRQTVATQDFVVLGFCFLVFIYLVGCRVAMKRDEASKQNDEKGAFC